MGTGTGKRKHIVYVVSDTAYGGGTRYFASLVEGLDRDEYSFGAACPAGSSLETYFRDLGVVVYPFPVLSRFDGAGMVKFARMLSREKIDCLLLGDGCAWNSGFFLKILSGIPHIWAIVHMTHIGLEIRKFGRLERLAARLYDYLWSLSCETIIVSNRKNAGILESEGVRPDKLHVIPNCIVYADFDAGRYTNRDILRRQLGVDNEKKIIGMVARLGPGKDFETLLNAAARVVMDFPGCIFLLVGTGPYREKLESRAQELGLTGKVVFTGWVEDAYEYLNLFDVFVFSTVAEGIPYGILEAMAFGKPIVSTNNGAISEAISHDTAGLLVEPGSIESLAAGLSEVLRDSPRAQQLGQNAKKTVEEHFNISIMLNKFDELF